jgi:hypothetical protein
VRLFEHPDFDQVILQAAKHFQLRPAIIEKDYYVTEVLRIIAATAGDKVIFKGGTSLSKGWNLIQRFSEDIDLFLDPLAFEPPLTKRGIDRELKSLRDAVAAHPALQFVPEESQTIGGFGRNDRFSYHQLHGGSGEVANLCSSKQVQPAVGNPPRMLSCAPTSFSFCRKKESRSGRKTKARSRCACSISGEPS